jgi:DNA-binding CsgD family transcriptional regulator
MIHKNRAKFSLPGDAASATVQADPTRSFSAALQHVMQAHGFRFFLAASFPQADKLGFRANIIAGNWPQELIDRYDASDLFWRSQLIEDLKKTIMPIYSGTGMFAQPGNASNSEKLARNFEDLGLHNTISFTLHDAILRHYVIMFSGLRSPPDEQECARMVFAVLKSLDSFSLATEPPLADYERLTVREIECLRWSASGKSSEEIAIILHISAHTVNGYLKTAMRKLDAVNRMQAVVRAYRFRLI